MMQKHQFDSYQDFWEWSVKQKAAFWDETVENLGIQLVQPYTSILDTTN